MTKQSIDRMTKMSRGTGRNLAQSQVVLEGQGIDGGVRRVRLGDPDLGLLFFQRRQVGAGAARVDAQGALDRQPKGKKAPLAQLALDQDVAAVLAENFAADGQAQAGALGPLAADKRPENVSHF